MHLAALGLPILGDRIYPKLLGPGADEPENPLRLLAESIAFIDPISGQDRHFASNRQLHFPGSASRTTGFCETAQALTAPCAPAA